MKDQEIKERLKAGESVEFVTQASGRKFSDVYKLFDECKTEGYVKVKSNNRLKRRVPNGKLVHRPKTDTLPEAYINIDKIVSIYIDNDGIRVHTDSVDYKIDENTLNEIKARMGVI